MFRKPLDLNARSDPARIQGKSFFIVRGRSAQAVSIAVALINDLLEGVREDLEQLRKTTPAPPAARQQWADEEDDDDDFAVHLTQTQPRPQERQPQQRKAPGDVAEGRRDGRRQPTSTGGSAGGGLAAARGAPGRAARGVEAPLAERRGWPAAADGGKGGQSRRRVDGGGEAANGGRNCSGVGAPKSH